jgi:hypothetical protein
VSGELLCGLPGAIRVVLACLPKYRLPARARLADKYKGNRKAIGDTFRKAMLRLDFRVNPAPLKGIAVE